ncbi:hypothetical protein C2869_06395 [Saccharobesus litoralis]|uniref:Solute-binding protein family 3/N-terminal domain-containing protein n=1 Tax=Saccharobesus litoralis TaxID=2172099 RepID=A0A2S0VPH7_9ALTE|nr:hypothetical protein [Saccharobesus litoralis]AWB66092.1 hypothetical protein C2869_06395 [Saccharobesus litoralis]
MLWRYLDKKSMFINRLTKRVLILLVCLVCSWPVYCAEKVILISPSDSPNDARGEYAFTLLQKALNASQLNQNYQVELSQPINEARAYKQLTQGRSLHVMWAAYRAHWQQQLNQINKPILKGLLGQRVFLINQQEQVRFNQINHLHQLKALNLGTGHIWSITPILKRHGFNLVTSSSYDGLFAMLSKQRFDYFPRGINEVIAEYRYRKPQYPNLTIEKTILLQLDLPVYFYVTPSKPQLAVDITRGLDTLEHTGQFDRLFNQYFAHLDQALNLSTRKVFKVAQ